MQIDRLRVVTVTYVSRVVICETTFALMNSSGVAPVYSSEMIL